MKNKKYIKRAYSKSPLMTFTWNKDIGTVFPDFSFQAVDQMINEDPVARGAMIHFVDKCMEGEYNIIKKSSLKYDRTFELLLDEKYEFRQEILRKLFYTLKLYNNAFIEIVKNTDGSVKSLNIIDSQNMDTITESNGDVKGFRSKVPDQTTGQYATWDKDEIIWVKNGDRSKGWAPTDLRAVYDNLLMKKYLKRYVAWLWKTGQYRLNYNFENASNTDIENFLVYARKHDDNFKAPFIAKGKLTTSILRDMKETESLVELLKYYDGQTLIAMRIPPIDAGIPDASGRSNSDAQSNNLATHVTSIKKLVEDKINFVLFPRMSKGNTMLRFSAVDRFAEKQVFENLQIMQSMGMTNEVMQEYMGDRGIFFKATVFKKPEDMESGENPRDKDTMPSRTGKGEGEADQVIGSGEQSSTREDQLRKE